MTDSITVALTGWTHVHTWHESHGDHVQRTYQREITSAEWGRRVSLLTVSVYRDGRPSGVRVEDGKFAHDYLLARDIRANPTRYVKNGDRSITPCCTAGSDDFTDKETGIVYRIFGAAGHGEWAFQVDGEG